MDNENALLIMYAVEGRETVYNLQGKIAAIFPNAATEWKHIRLVILPSTQYMRNAHSYAQEREQRQREEHIISNVAETKLQIKQ